MKTGRRSKRSSFKPSIGKMLRRFSGWGNKQGQPNSGGAKAPDKPRRQGFGLEAMEPRVLMSADISYASLGSLDMTAKAEQSAGKFFINLYETANPASKVGGVQLTAADDVTVNIARVGGEPGGALFADTVRFDLDTLGSIDGFVNANGGLLSLDFKGGAELLQDDHVFVLGTGGASIGYGLTLTADTDITINASKTFTGALTIQSDESITGSGQTNFTAAGITIKADAIKDGGIVGTGFLADSNASITLTNSKLSSSGALTIEAHGKATADDDGTSLSKVTGAILTSNSEAKITIGGASQLSGTAVVVKAFLEADLKGKADKNTVKLVAVQGMSDPSISIAGTTKINATTTLAVTATSDVKITTSASPDAADKNAKFDAAVLSTTFKSGASLVIGGSAELTATNAVTIGASSKLVSSATADANVVGTAGAAVAVSVIYGDTQAWINTAKVTGNGVTVSATSDRSITTIAKSSPGGSDSNGGKNASETTLADNKAKTSSGNLTIAGAVAVSTDTGKTAAWLNGSTIDAKAGAAKVTTSSIDVVTVKADGQFTGKGATGVGIGVAIGVANRSNLAYIQGNTSITAGSLAVEVLAPSTSIFTAEAIAGVGASSKVGVAGSLAINVSVLDNRAYLNPGATLTLTGNPNVTFAANSDVTHVTRALPAAKGNADPSKVGVGASVALTYEEVNTSANIGDLAALTGANNLILTADADLETTTEAKSGSKGSTAITPVVAITIAANDVSATLGTGALLTVGGKFEANAVLANNAATTAEGDTLSGGTGVGISVAVSVINDNAVATTGRDLTTLAGTAAFLSTVISGSHSTARASVAGGEQDDSSGTQKVDDKTGGEQDFGAKTASDQTKKANPGGSTKGTQGASSPDAKTSGGSVSVAGAVAVNIANASSMAYVGDGRIITSSGVLTLKSQANVDGTAAADGKAVIGSTAFDPTTAVNTTNEEITIGASAGLKTGDKVTYNHGDGGTDIKGLKNGSSYFVRDAGSGKYVLYDTKDHADAGGATGRIDLQDKGAGTQHAFKGAGAGGTGVGVAVTVNYADAVNLAYIGGSTIDAGGLDVQATVADRVLAFNPATKASTVNETIDVGQSGLRTGDEVVYQKGPGGTAMGGLTEGRTYFVNVQSDGKLKLYTSHEDAVAGTATGRVNITSVGAGTSHRLVDRSHGFGAWSLSGAGGGSTGVAGSLAINLGFTDTQVQLGYKATTPTVGLKGGGDMTLKAASAVTNVASAKPFDGGGDGTSVGVGVSVSMDYGQNTTLAGIGNGVVVTGAGKVTLDATTTQGMISESISGAKGSTAVTPVVAIAIAANETHASIGTGGLLTASGAISVTASLTDTVWNTAKGDTQSNSTGVGISVAVSVVNDKASATTNRNLTSGGAITFASSATSASNASAFASVAGGQEDDGSGDHEGANKQSTDNTANKEANYGDSTAKSADAGATGTGGAKSDKGSTSNGSVSVAGAVAINIANVTTQAFIPDSRTITAAGMLSVKSAANADAITVANGSASTSDGGVGVGAAVSVNIGNLTNRAYIGNNAVISSGGLDVRAVMTTREYDLSVVTNSIVDVAGDTIFVGMKSGLKTGDQVTYKKGAGGNTAIGGLTSGNDYYVNVKDGGKVQLYDTEENANAGGSTGRVDLTAGATGSNHEFTFGLLGLTGSVKFNPADSVRFVDVGGDTALRTGDAVVYEAGAGAMGGLADGTTYYVIEVTPGLYQLAASRTDAVAGKAINLTTSGGAGQQLIDATHTSRAEATSGAGGGDVGVAGSVTVNSITRTTEAQVGRGGKATITITGGGNVTVAAANTGAGSSVALPSNGGGKGSDVGIGASVAVNVLNNVTTAEITDATVWSGAAGTFSVTATSSSTAITDAENGAASDNVAVGVGASVAVLNDTTKARIGTGGGIITAAGAVNVRAQHAGDFETTTDAEAAGKSVGVGASVSVAVVTQNVTAELARSLTTSGGVLNVEAISTVTNETKAVASAGGTSEDDSNQNSKSGKSGSDGQADKQVNDNKNTQGQDLSSASASQGTSDASGKNSSQGGGGSSGVSVAASVAVSVLTANVTAKVTNGADLTATNQAIAVKTSSLVATSAKAIGAALGMENDVNIGAGVSVSVVNATNKAQVGSGSVLTGKGVVISALTPAGKTNSLVAWGASAGGGKGDVGIAGSVAINIVNTFDTEASAAAGSTIVSTGLVTVEAKAKMDMQTLAAAGAFSQGTAVGLAVAVGVLDVNTTAYIGGSVDASGAIAIRAENALLPTKIDLPFLDDADDPRITAVALAGAASNGDAAIGASVIVDDFHIDANAYLGDGAKVNQGAKFAANANQDLTIRAVNSLEIVSVAGALSLTTGSAGIGAGVDVELVSLNTRAYIGKGALVQLGGSADIIADQDLSMMSVAAVLSVADSAAVAATASIQVVSTDARAYIAGVPAPGAATKVAATDSIVIDADSDFKVTMIAGSVGVAGTAGIGAANATLVHTANTTAFVGERATVSAGGNGLDIHAHAHEDVLSVSAGIAIGGSVGVAGSADVTVLNETTSAYVGRSATITIINGDLDISASDLTEIISVAGSLAGGSVGVGMGADVGVFTKTTLAYIDSGVSATVDDNILVTAVSEEDLISVSAGLAAGSVAVGVNAGVHVFNIATKAFIGDDPDDATASAGGGNVFANGSIVIFADDYSNINEVAGSLAAGGVGIGAAAGVNVLNKDTKAFVGAGAVVRADGNRTGLTVNTGRITPGVGALGDTYEPGKAKDKSPGIETSSGGTLTAAKSGDRSSLRAQGTVGTPSLSGMDLDGNGSKSKVDDPSFNGPRVTSLATQAGFRGLSVSAVNRDEIRTFSVSASFGGVAVAFSAGVEVVNAKTSAYIGNNAKINTSTTGANTAQSVLVAAGDDFYHLMVTAGLGAGGVAVTPAVGVNIVTNTTKAWIGSGASVKALNDVTVQATAKEDLVMVGVGIAAGGIGIGGVVDVLKINNQTHALIMSSATVLAGGDVFVSAMDDTHVLQLSGAIAAGAVGVGASVGVMIIDKDTAARIGSSATVEALGNGVGVSQIVTGQLAGSTIQKAMASGVIVQAESSEDILHIVAAAGAGFVGVAGSLGVTLIRATTGAVIESNAIINRTNHGKASLAQSVHVNGANKVEIDTYMIGIAGGFVGVAGAVDIGTLNNDVKAEIQGGAKVSARDDVRVNAVSVKDLKGFDASGGFGVVGVAGAVSVWSIGKTIETSYSDNEGNTKNSLVADKGSADADAGQQANTATKQVTGDIGETFAGKGANANSSASRVNSITGSANTTVGAAAPTKNTITNMISQVAPVPPGTSAMIQAGADIDATDDISVQANTKTKIQIDIGSVSAGLVGVGASVAVLSVADNVSAFANGVLNAGDDIAIAATLNGETDMLVLSGSAGFVGLGAAVAVITDTSLVQAALGSVEKADAITVKASNTRNISETTGQVVGGAVGAGIVFTRVDVSGGSVARVNNGAVLGNISPLGSLSITASESTTVHSKVVAVTAGIGAFGANFSFIKVNPTVSASISPNANINVKGAVTVTASATIDGHAEALGVAAGGLAVGASLTDVTIEPTVTASLGNPLNAASGAVTVKAGSLTVAAKTLLPASGYTARSASTGSAGALIGVTSTNAVIEDNATVKSFIGDGSILTIVGATFVTAVNNTRQKSSANSNSGGLIAAGIAYAQVDSDADVQAFVGKNVSVKGSSLTIGANGKDDNFAYTNAGSGGLIAGSSSVARTTNLSTTQARIDNGAVITLSTGDGALTVGADQTAAFNSQITTFAGGLFAGAGGEIRNTTNAKTDSKIGDSVTITAKSIDLNATTHLDKPWLTGGTTENIKGTTGGLVSGAGASDKTTISVSSKVTIGASSKLSVTGIASNAHTFKMTALNDWNVRDKVSFITGGALSGAAAVASIDVKVAEATVQVAGTAVLNSTNAIDMSARGHGTLKQLISTETYGLGTATVGHATVNLRPDNQIIIGAGAKITAYGDINLSAGSDTNYNEDEYTIESRYDGFAGSLIPISSIGATGYLIADNKITIGTGAHLKTARDANLFTDRFGTNQMDVQAKAQSWVSELQSALLKAQGGGALLDYAHATILGVSHGVIQMNGTVETGIIRHQNLSLNAWDGLTGKITGFTATDGVTFTTGQEAINNPLIDELEHYENLLKQYGNENPSLKTFYEERIASIVAELLSDGLVTVESDGKGGNVYIAAKQYVMTVTVDPIWADSGSITTRGDVLQGSGKWIAPNDASVKIINDTPAFLKIKGIDIPTQLGGLFFNGDQINTILDVTSRNTANVKEDNLLNNDGGSPLPPFIPGAVSFNLTGVKYGLTEPSVLIQNRLDVEFVNISGNYKVNGKDPTYPWPDIIVMSLEDGGVGIHNVLGDVTIQTLVPGFNPNSKGDIKIFGPVVSKSLTLTAGGQLFIQTPIFESGGSPMSQWGDVTTGSYNPNNLGQVAAGVSKATPEEVKAMLKQTPGADGAIYADKIFIDADIINLNGRMQSGKADYSLSLGAATTARINDLIGSGATGLVKLVEDSSADFSVYFDMSTKRIEVQDLRVSGGDIEMHGSILNTGNGELLIFGGYGKININNATSFDLGLHRIDVSERGGGTLVIHDETPGSNVVKIYQQNENGLTVSTSTNGAPAVVQNNQALDSVYTPTSDWRYGWTVGVSQLVHKTKRIVDSSWIGLIDLGTDISEWDTTEIQGQPTLEGPGPYYYRSGSGGDYAYSTTTVTISDPVRGQSAAETNTTWYGETSITVDFWEDSGTRLLHTHTISAARPIGVHFFGYETGTVTVNSNSGGSVYIEGPILNDRGTTSITTNDRILSGSAAGYVGGNRVVLSAANGIGTANTALRVDVGGTAFASLSAITTSGIVNLVQTDGDMAIDKVMSKDFDKITLAAPGSITVAQKSAGVWYEGLVSGGALTLSALTGAIGNGSIRPLVIDMPLPANVKADLNDSLIATATTDISLKVKSGDLRVKSIITGGDVYINVAAGSLIDANDLQVRDERTYAELKAGVWSSLQLTAGTGYADKVAATIQSFVSAKTQEYNTYWQFRHMQADGGAVFDAGFQVTLDAAETDYYQNELGYDAAALQTLVNMRTATYHTLNSTYGVGGTYGSVNDLTYNANVFAGNFVYKSTVAETTSLTSSIKQWTEDQLLYAISAGLMKDVTSTVVNIEEPNIIADEITIITKNNVGQKGDETLIDLTPPNVVFTDDQRVALAAAERLDVQYLGGAVVTATVSFDAGSRTIVRTAAGSWIAAGFTAGMYITIDGANGQTTQNATIGTNIFHRIQSVTASVITLDNSTTLTTESSRTVKIAPIVLDPTFQPVGSSVVATVQFTGNTLTDAAQITRTSAGSFIADGFAINQLLTLSGSAANSTTNGMTYRIASVTANVITLSSTASITTEAFDQVVTLRRGTAPVITAIKISHLDDINVTAGGGIDITAGKGVLLGSTVNIKIERVIAGSVVAGDKIRIKGTLSIIDAAAPGLAYIRGDDVILEAAQGGIGTQAAPITLDSIAGGTLTARAKNTIWINGVNTAGPGNLNLESVFSQTGNANLGAKGSILDAFNTDFPKVKAQFISLQADKAIGAAGNYVDVQAAKTVTAEAGGNIWIAQFEGDLRIDHIQSFGGNVDLRAEFSIVDAASAKYDNSGSPTLPAADVIGNSISLTALIGGIGDALNALDINSQFSGGGTLTSSSKALNTYIIETLGDVALNTVATGDKQSAFITAPTGSITNGAPGKHNVLSGNTKLFASKDIGALGNAIKTKVGHIEAQSTTGSTYVDNDGELAVGGDFTGDPNGVVTGGSAVITAASPITLTKSILAGGNVLLHSVDDAFDGNDPAKDDVPDHMIIREKDLFGQRLFIKAAGSIYLLSGDDLTVERDALIQAGVSAVLWGDYGNTDGRLVPNIGDGRDTKEGKNADPLKGTTIIVAGTVTAPTIIITGDSDEDRIFVTTGKLTAMFPWLSASEFASVFGEKAQYPRERPNNSEIYILGQEEDDLISVWGDVIAREIRIFGNAGEDVIGLNPENPDGYKLEIFGQVSIFGGAGLDDITVNKLNTLDIARKLNPAGVGADKLVTGLVPGMRYTVNIDGGGAADLVTVNMTGANDSIINVHDNGSPGDGSDTLVINGTEDVDTFLLRAGFVALLQENAGGYATTYERVNYDDTVNVLRVNAYKGDDSFFVDDNSAITQLDGGIGNDFFQFGQLFGNTRIAPNRVATGDTFPTFDTTLGFLSRGVSFATVAYGGDGNDQMHVYSNRAPLELYGELGIDSFIVRAFAYKKASDPVVINAPVRIDGGGGSDDVTIIGSELADNFVVSRDAVVGAGLNVGIRNVSSVEVDAMQGDDRFYVLSTEANVATMLIGGLGTDSFDVGGDVVSPIIANSIEGKSGFINHNVISAGSVYDGVHAEGVSLNVASARVGPLMVTQSGGNTIVREGNLDPKTASDSYTLRMADPASVASLSGVAYVTVSAATASYRAAAAGGRTVKVSLDNVNFVDSLVLAFDPYAVKGTAFAWDRTRTIYVRADQDTLGEGETTVIISHSIVSVDPVYNRANVANVEVRVIDDDRPGVTIEPSGTTTRVVEGGAKDNYTVVLTRAPKNGEVVTVKLSTNDEQVKLSVDTIQFTSANWNVPVTVTLTAINDTVLENRAEVLITHTVNSNQVAGFYANVTDVQNVVVDVHDNDTPGVLITTSNGGTLVAGSLSDTYQVQLTSAPTAPVFVQILTDGQTIVLAHITEQDPTRFSVVNGVPTIRFDATNWSKPFLVAVEVNPLFQAPFNRMVYPAQPHLTSPIQGPLTLEGGEVAGKVRTLNKAIMLPTEKDVATPVLNIVVDEKTKTDTVNVFNDGSVQNDSGVFGLAGIPDGLAAQYGVAIGSLPLDEFGNIRGLNMGDKQEVDMTRPGKAAVLPFNAGITFHAIEVADVMLGTGKDSLEIETTLKEMITVVQGGGGDDILRATGGGGDSSPLILFGDTSQDGSFYNATTANLTGRARAFTNHGNDTIDASKMARSVTIFGGRGNDVILGSNEGDWLAGGSGNDTIRGYGGVDIVSGDTGFNINITQRLSLSTQILTIAVDVAAADVPATRDTLLAGNDTILGGDGNDILFGDYSPASLIPT